MSIREIEKKIKRQEGPIFSAIYRLGKKAQKMEIPVPPSLVQPLFHMRRAAMETTRQFNRLFIYQPLMRSYCESCGKNLQVDIGVPYIYGNLRIIIGDDCHINGHGAISASKVYDDPTLTIGDRTYIGYGLAVNVAKEVRIGNDVLISDMVVISDNPGHPIDSERRSNGHGVDLEQIKPVVIEDKVWLGQRTTILPGVTIGEGSIVGTGAVVSKSVEPYSLVVGNPARVAKKLK